MFSEVGDTATLPHLLQLNFGPRGSRFDSSNIEWKLGKDWYGITKGVEDKRSTDLGFAGRF
jgi:hypothetical protein